LSYIEDALHRFQTFKDMFSLGRALNISNNSSFGQKLPGVKDGSDGSDDTLYPLMENYTLPVTQATGRIA
jgi:hypothetical protein